MSKNIAIAVLAVSAVILGAALMWQGVVKDAVETRAALAEATHELGEATAEIEIRKRVWQEMYSPMQFRGMVTLRRSSNADPTSYPLVVVVPQKGRFEFASDGASHRKTE